MVGQADTAEAEIATGDVRRVADPASAPLDRTSLLVKIAAGAHHRGRMRELVGAQRADRYFARQAQIAARRRAAARRIAADPTRYRASRPVTHAAGRQGGPS